MKEELKNNLLERIKVKNRVGYKNVLDNYSQVVLERLSSVKDDKVLRILLRDLSDLMENNVKTNDELLLMMIEIIENRHGLDNFSFYDIIFDRKMIDSKKIECLNKVLKATKDFQINYIHYIYENNNIAYKDLIADIILKCSKEFQVVGIYSIFSNIETEKEKECIAEYIELAKIIAKEKDKYKVNIYTDINWNINILDLGLLLPVAKLISKCKCGAQAKNMDNYLNNLNSENAPYVLKYSEYFLRTTAENKLNSLYKYLTFCLNQSLLIEEDKINLIINARNKFNGEAIEDSLTYGKLIDINFDGVAAEILNESRKEYNANYASKIIYDASIDSLSAAMIVNESETRYKAQKVYNTIILYANTDEIGKSLEFAALINSVHSNLEIDLIYLLSQNSYLNKLGIDLPIARIIANATDSENDAIKIWECLKDEENRKNAINGFATLIQNINSQKRQKAEEIINMVLLKAQNKPIHLDVVESVVQANEKLTTKVKKLVNKKLKK